jgi:hypothetical protein
MRDKQNERMLDEQKKIGQAWQCVTGLCGGMLFRDGHGRAGGEAWRGRGGFQD